MQSVDLNKVASCSSEDPAYPASNLLLSNGSHKWKCAKPGEQKAIVCFQLKSPVKFVQIDVGNEGSALVEVLVSRSADPTDTWQVLLAASSLMSPADAKKSTDLNRVRTFRSDQLHKPASNEKWDRVRVICSQPFSKTLQYGLSFFKMSAAADASGGGETVHTKVGDFKIRDEDEDAEDVKADEAKKQKNGVDKDPDSSRATKTGNGGDTSAAITKPGGLFSSAVAAAAAKSKKSEAAAAEESTSKKAPAKPKLFHASSGDEDDEEDDKVDSKNRTKKADNTTAAAADDSSKDKKSSSNEFSRILSGVVFAMSGYQNPRRGQLRDKATKMGAKYRPDWGPGCTHLVCAFANTPKFSQVRGKGKIVLAEWIEQCYKERRLVDWELFDLAAKAGSGGGGGRPTRAVASKKPNYVADDDDDTDDSDAASARRQKNKRLTVATPTKKRARGVSDSDDEDDAVDDDDDDDDRRARVQRQQKRSRGAKASKSSDEEWRGGADEEEDDDEAVGEEDEAEDRDGDSDSDYKLGGGGGKKKLKRRSSASGKKSPLKRRKSATSKKPALPRQPSSRPVRAAAVVAAAKAKISDSDEDDDFEDEDEQDRLTTKPKPATPAPPKRASPTKKSPPQKKKTSTGDDDNESDASGSGWAVVRRKKGDADEAEKVSPPAAKKPRHKVSQSEEEHEEEKEQADQKPAAKPAAKDAEFDADTDIEDDKPAVAAKPEDLPDFFKGAHFFIYGDSVDSEERRQLKRVIYAFNGYLDEYNGPGVKYIVTRNPWDKNFDDALEDNAGVMFVKPDWLFELERTRKYCQPNKYQVVAA